MDSTTKEFEAKVQRLEQSLAEHGSLERRASRAVLCLSGALTLLILAFLGINYVHLRSEWTEEKFATSLRLELAELNPIAMLELKTLGETLLPVYADESRRQLTKLGPHISDALVSSVELVAKDLRREGRERLESSQKRIEDKLYDTIFMCFPTLEREPEQQKLEEAFRRTTHQAISDAIGSFQDKYGKEIQIVQERITKYDLGESDVSDFELQKRFLSLWLQLLDTEIQKL